MDEQYIRIHSVEGRHVAELIQKYFQAVGIPLEISQESAGSTLGLTVAPLGVAHLMVSSSRLEEAKDLLEEYLSRGEGKIMNDF